MAASLIVSTVDRAEKQFFCLKTAYTIKIYTGDNITLLLSIGEIKFSSKLNIEFVVLAVQPLQIYRIRSKTGTASLNAKVISNSKLSTTHVHHTVIDRFRVYITLEYVGNIYHTSRNLSIADTARDANLKAAFIARINNERRYH